MLSTLERVLAGTVALAVGILAWRAEVNPPLVTKTTGSAACAVHARDCVVKVSADTSTVVVALIALAAAAAVIALLGIRFTKVSAGGASLESDVMVASVDDAQKATGASLAPTREQASSKRGLTAATTASSDEVFETLPGWAQESLITWANRQTAVTRPIAYAVFDAAKEKGRGNKPWYVTVEQDSGETIVLRVATGRGGTRIGEHAAA